MSSNGRLSKGMAAALVHLAKAKTDGDDTSSDFPHAAATWRELRGVGTTPRDLEWLAMKNLVRRLAGDGDLADTTRFELTYAGRLFIHSHGLNGAPRVKQRPASKRIEWRPAEYVLLVDGCVARKYKRRATKQWPFLDQFAAQNWRRPLKIEFDCDGRDPAHRLREIVSDLNDGLDESLLHFELDGEGRVTFKIGQAEPARQTA